MTTKIEELWIPSLQERTLRKDLNIKVKLKQSLKGKTLGDWVPFVLPLLGVCIISATLLLGVSRLGAQEQNSTRQIILEQNLLAQQALTQQKQELAQQKTLALQQASLVDQGHEQILTNYLNDMSALLSSPTSPLKQSGQNIGKLLAQTKTIGVLHTLSADAVRSGIALQFLHDTGLITVPRGGKGEPIIVLTGVTLSGVNLSQASLSSSDFDGVIMSNAIFSNAVLTGSSFRGATLTKTNFSAAILENVDFSGAVMENANLTRADLKGANLDGADTKNTITKGSTW